MDTKLQKRLTKWHRQIEKLQEFESDYLNLKASEDSFESALTLKQEGSSMAEKRTKAEACKEYRDFKLGLAQAETLYNREKRLLAVMIKAFDAEYLECKRESEAIQKYR